MVERSGPWRVALLDALRDGVFVLDADGSIVEINRAFTEILGFGPDGLPYRQPYPWLPDPNSDSAAHADVVAALGEFEGGRVARWELPQRHRDGHRVWVEISADPVDDAHEPGVSVVGLIRDVTAEHRARAREQVLFELSRLLAEPTGLEERLARFVRHLAEQAGDLVVIARTEPDGRLRVTDAAHPDRPDLAEWALGLGPGRPPPVVDAQLRAGVSFVTDHVPDLPLTGFDDAGALPSKYMLFAGGVAPIAAGGRLLGALALVRTTPTRTFDQADLGLGEELGRRLAGVMDADRVASGEQRLHDATAALAAAVTVGQAAAVLADAVGRAMGAAGTSVHVPDPDTPGRLVLLHNEGFSDDLAKQWAGVQTREASPIADAARDGAALWLHSPQVWRARYPALEADTAVDGLVAFAALPLTLGGQVLGVLWASFRTTRVFPDSERDFVSTLVAHAAQAFERAALTDARWRVAQTMQRALLPTALPTLPGLTLAAHYQPAGVHSQAGGDWYDVIPLDADRVAVVIGDVVGAGASAAAIMGQLRGAVAALLLDTESCAEALQQLSRVAARIPGAELSTALILILNSVTGEMSWARAGHLPPLLLDPHDPEQPARYLTDAHGPSLGIIEALTGGHESATALQHQQARLVLRPGESVLLYTDGLVERRGRLIDDCLDELRETLAFHAGAATDELLALAVSAVPSTVRPSDDIAVVIVRLAPVAPSIRIPAALRLALPARPEQLRPLRRAVTDWAGKAHLSKEFTGDLQLAVGEAAANSIEHAYPAEAPGEFSCVIEYTSDAQVRVEVQDHGSWRTPPSNTGFRGRGLHFIRTIADDVTLQASATGTTIVFTISIPQGDRESPL